MERKLRKVEALPQQEAKDLLELPSPGTDVDVAEELENQPEGKD